MLHDLLSSKRGTVGHAGDRQVGCPRKRMQEWDDTRCPVSGSCRYRSAILLPQTVGIEASSLAGQIQKRKLVGLGGAVRIITII